MSFAQAALNFKTEREHARNAFGLLPQGYCKRKPPKFEKTTSNVLSVLLLIYMVMVTLNCSAVAASPALLSRLKVGISQFSLLSNSH